MSDATRAVIAPPIIKHSNHHAEVTLSFGPVAIVQTTNDNAGFVIDVLRGPAGPFSVPVLKARVTFGPDLKPVLELLEVTPL